MPLRPLLAALVIALGPAVSAQTGYTWVGGGAGSWQTPSNWSPAGVPAAGDTASFPDGTAARVTLDADVSVGAVTAEGHSDVVLTSDAHRFVLVRSITNSAYYDTDETGGLEFDLRVDEVVSINSRGNTRLPDVGRVGYFRSLTTFGGDLDARLGGFDHVDIVELGGTTLWLDADGGTVGSILFEQEVAGYVRLSGTSMTIGSIGIDPSAHFGYVYGAPGLRLLIEGPFGTCDPSNGITCRLDGVDLTLGGETTLRGGVPGDPALTVRTLSGTGPLRIEGRGGVSADVVDYDGQITVDGEGERDPATITIADWGTFGAEAIFVAIVGGPDPDREAVELSDSVLRYARLTGVRAVVVGSVELTAGTSSPTTLTDADVVVEGGGALRLAWTVVGGTGSTIENGGHLRAEWVRVGVPTTTSGVLSVPLAVPGPPPEDGDVAEPPHFTSLTAGGTLAGTLDGPAPALGDVYTLFTYGALAGAFDAHDLPALPPGLGWAVTSDDGAALAAVVERDAVACATGAPLYIASFAAGDPGRAAVRNSAPEVDVDLGPCTLAVYDGFSERVVDAVSSGSEAAPMTGVPFGPSIAVGRPGAVVLAATDLVVGDGVSDAAGAVVAAVVYDGDGRVHGECGRGPAGVQGGPLAPCDSDDGAASVSAALAALFGGAVGVEDDGPGALAVSVAPNPTGRRSAVAYRLAEAGPVRLAVYDALGREVAVLAEGPHGPGRHGASLDVADLPAGVYAVRLTAASDVRVVRVTVAR